VWNQSRKAWEKLWQGKKQEIGRKAFNRALRLAAKKAETFGMTGLPVASAIKALIQPVPKRRGKG
jgi:hypothetical protein